jgi:hypothetical protein
MVHTINYAVGLAAFIFMALLVATPLAIGQSPLIWSIVIAYWAR